MYSKKPDQITSLCTAQFCLLLEILRNKEQRGEVSFSDLTT